MDGFAVAFCCCCCCCSRSLSLVVMALVLLLFDCFCCFSVVVVVVVVVVLLLVLILVLMLALLLLLLMGGGGERYVFVSELRRVPFRSVQARSVRPVQVCPVQFVLLPTLVFVFFFGGGRDFALCAREANSYGLRRLRYMVVSAPGARLLSCRAKTLCLRPVGEDDGRGEEDDASMK